MFHHMLDTIICKMHHFCPCHRERKSNHSNSVMYTIVINILISEMLEGGKTHILELILWKRKVRLKEVK